MTVQDLPLKPREGGSAASSSEAVYHYTTMEAMMKIANSAAIWATSISYLNDASEREHFLTLIRKRFPKFCEIHAPADSEIFAGALLPRKDAVRNRPFVASFSEEGDSLTQWRSYCPKGNGVAIGFRVDCLERAFLRDPRPHSDEVSFGPVNYVDSDSLDREKQLDKQILAILRTARSIESKFKLNGKPFSAKSVFPVILQNRAVFHKHSSFAGEHEYRLVVSLSSATPIEFRFSGSTLVPYVSINIPRRSEGAAPENRRPDRRVRRDFIRRVVIGPTVNPNLSAEAVKLFFQARMKVEVVHSKVPYRDW